MTSLTDSCGAIKEDISISGYLLFHFAYGYYLTTESTMFQTARQIIVKNHQFWIYLYCVCLGVFFLQNGNLWERDILGRRARHFSRYEKPDIFWRQCSASYSLTSLAPQLDCMVGWSSETAVHPATAIAKPQSYGYKFPQQEEWQVQKTWRSLVYSKSQSRTKACCRTQHAGQLRKMKISKHLWIIVINQYFRESKSVPKIQHFKWNTKNSFIVEPTKAKECS